MQRKQQRIKMNILPCRHCGRIPRVYNRNHTNHFNVNYLSNLFSIAPYNTIGYNFEEVYDNDNHYFKHFDCCKKGSTTFYGGNWRHLISHWNQKQKTGKGPCYFYHEH